MSSDCLTCLPLFIGVGSCLLILTDVCPLMNKICWSSSFFAFGYRIGRVSTEHFYARTRTTRCSSNGSSFLQIVLYSLQFRKFIIRTLLKCLFHRVYNAKPSHFTAVRPLSSFLQITQNLLSKSLKCHKINHPVGLASQFNKKGGSTVFTSHSSLVSMD